MTIDNEIPANEVNDSKETMLAMWQTCVEQASAVSSRRDTMNNWFLTLQSALAVALFSIDGITTFAIYAISALSLAMSIVWIIMIQNFKFLNSAKFEVINKLEECLKVKPMKAEWQIIKNGCYVKGTLLELSFPFIFILYFGVIVVIEVIKKCN